MNAVWSAERCEGNWICEWWACECATTESRKHKLSGKLCLWNEIRATYHIHGALNSVRWLGIAVEVEEVAAFDVTATDSSPSIAHSTEVKELDIRSDNIELAAKRKLRSF